MLNYQNYQNIILRIMNLIEKLIRYQTYIMMIQID